MSEGHGVPARTKYERGELKGASPIAFDFYKSLKYIPFKGGREDPPDPEQENRGSGLTTRRDKLDKR
jgi:hypothetical protein